LRAKERASLSAAGTIHFGELVARLMNAGLERYQGDYSRMMNTCYTPDGGSCVEPMEHDAASIGEESSAAQVEAAVLGARHMPFAERQGGFGGLRDTSKADRY
jgi:hypothetical protein